MAGSDMNSEKLDLESIVHEDDPNATRVDLSSGDATVVASATVIAGAATSIGGIAGRAKLVLTPGQVLGRTYEIQELIGQGGMAAVYHAKNRLMNTEHAIKVMLPEWADDPQIDRMFREEARKLSILRHDATVAYQGIGQEENGLIYIVMEFVSGPSLARLMKTRGKISVDDVRLLKDRCAEGLAAAHDCGIVHRDLSPENIIVIDGMASKAKIIDFGIAKSLHPGDKTVVGKDNFAGRYSYASPEQLGVIDRSIDGRSDIYSLGLVLAAAAAGAPLSMGHTPGEIYATRTALPDLKSVPAELRGELERMLQPDPDRRPKTMRDLPKPVTGEGSISSSQGWAWLAAAVVIAAVLAASGGGYAYWKSTAAPTSITASASMPTQIQASAPDGAAVPPPSPAAARPPVAPSTTDAPAAPSLSDANDAYDRKDYATTLRLYQALAATNNAQAQYQLGSMYQLGQGVLQDNTAAVRWYQRAADQGSKDAQLQLGYMAQNGFGMLKNYATALHWYQLAAAQGSAPAQNQLGYLYQIGSGVQVNYAEAMRWYRQAADQGSAPAQFRIGHFYAEGLGVPRDLTAARDWMTKAAAGGNADARAWLAKH